MGVRADIQKLDPGARVELFELDATALGGDVEYFHPGTNALRSAITWQGNVYTPWPFEAEGFEFNGRGQMPTPRIRVSNVGGEMTVRCLAYDDLIGAKLTRRRTFARYLDGEPGADPTAEFPDDIFYVERKVAENRVLVEWELSSLMDLEGVLLPKRAVMVNACAWISIGGYRGPYCGYDGAAVAKADDTATSDLSLDRCGGRLVSCQLRFGELGPLPFGGQPGAARR